MFLYMCTCSRCAYIYILHTHICAVGLKCWPGFGLFRVKMLAAVELKCWPRSRRATFTVVPRDFLFFSSF